MGEGEEEVGRKKACGREKFGLDIDSVMRMEEHPVLAGVQER